MRNKIIVLKVLFFIFFLLSILVTFNLLVIEKKGYPKRFEKLKEINKNYNPDNFFLAASRMGKFNIDKTFNSKIFNILIVGDSFAEDLQCTKSK